MRALADIAAIRRAWRLRLAELRQLQQGRRAAAPKRSALPKECRSRGGPECDPNVDDVWACIRRAGGIDPDRSGMWPAELAHAFGGPRQIPRGVIRRGGLTDSRMAEYLHGRGYTSRPWESYDEREVLQYLTSCAHGWSSCRATPEINDCSAARAEREGYENE